jgi:hypothetical protein
MNKLSRREALVGTAAVAAATVLPVPKAIPVELTFNVEIAAASMLDSLGAMWGVVHRHIGETDSSLRQRILDCIIQTPLKDYPIDNFPERNILSLNL